MNWKKPIDNIRKELTTYVTENDIKALVIGISGGIDSALCAVLANPVCKFIGIPLIGRSMPIATNKKDEIERAMKVGKAFCTDFKEERSFNPSLEEIYDHYRKLLSIKTGTDGTIEEKIRAGNLKARLRMIYLYDLAAKHKGIILSTDNYTELLLGFWTLHGDVGDYGMIQQLWKTEVYAMAQYVVATSSHENQRSALLDCIVATPTDGLGITNSDLDQLGAGSYDEVDRILKMCFESPEENIMEYADHPVILRYERTHFKRSNPWNISREKIFNEQNN